jgi:hypothetical protein
MATMQSTPFIYESAPSTTQSVRRSVADILFSVNAQKYPLVFCIATGAPVKEGEDVVRPGYITKRIVNRIAGNLRVEQAIWIEPARYKTVVSGSTLTLTFDDVTDMYVGQMWYNTSKETQGVVTTVNASPTNTVVFVTYGSTAFTGDTGDIIIPCGTSLRDNYSDIYYAQKAEDFVSNVMNTYGYAFEMGDLRRGADFFVNDYYNNMKELNWSFAVSGMENNFMFGKMPATGNMTTVGSYGIHHSQGLWDFAQTSISVGGAMTKDFLRKTLPSKLPTCIGQGKYIMFCGPEVEADIADIQYDKKTYIAEKDANGVFGITSNVWSIGNIELYIMSHGSFAYGVNRNKAFIFQMDDIVCNVHKDNDWTVKDNVQPAIQGGRKDKVTGTMCFLPKSGGYKMVQLKDIAF